MGRYRSRSRDRSRERDVARRSRSRSRSARRGSSRRSRSPYGYRSSGRNERDHRDRDRERDRSRERGSGKDSAGPQGRYFDGRDHPEPCPCLGVFGMSLHTTERDLKRIFGEYGEVESVQIVYDRHSGRSRGFGFVYFTSTRDATKAKEKLIDANIDGMKVRVDYSVTRGGGPYRHVFKEGGSPPRSPRRRRSRSPRSPRH